MTSDLDTLLRTPPTGALVRVDTVRVDTVRVDTGEPVQPEALADRLQGVGWRPVTTNAFADQEGFYTAIADALDFPSYFGRNLDALWDLLRDLTEPTVLILNWRAFAAADPEGAGRVLKVLQQRTEQGAAAFAVVLLD